MARTAQQVQADIDTMQAALGNPATRIRFADREIQYASQDDKLKGLEALQKELQALTSTTPTRQYRVYTSSGF
jgi:hypothetical protein